MSAPNAFGVHRNAARKREAGLSNALQRLALPVMAAIAFLYLAPLASADPLSGRREGSARAHSRETRRRAAGPGRLPGRKDVHLLNKPITSSGKMWFQAPNKFRREARAIHPASP